MTPELDHHIAGLILNGGRSQRMGRPKGELEYQGHTLLHMMRQKLLSAGVERTFVCGGNSEDALNDDIPFQGPLAGIHSAMVALQDKSFRGFLIVPVDMPVMEASALKALIKAGAELGNCHFLESVLPLYLTSESNTFRLLAECATSQDRSLKTFLRRLPAQALLSNSPKQFTNINYPEDWQRYCLSQAQNRSSNGTPA